MPLLLKRRSILPGFNLSLGYTTLYLSLIVLIPLAALALRATKASPAEWLATLRKPDVIAAFALTFGASLIAACINLVMGTIVAWVLVRYRFFGRKFVDALIDLPFALPTAVAGIALATVYASNGWLGQVIEGMWGIKVAYARLGIVVALTFISLPFVVRTVQPVVQELSREVEEAASSLGAGRWSTLRRVIWPEMWPAALTGFALAFARCIGEYGSVIFISSNLPMKTEIVPQLIFKRLEEYNYTSATVLAMAMLIVSFAMLLVINLLQRYGQKAAQNG